MCQLNGETEFLIMKCPRSSQVISNNRARVCVWKRGRGFLGEIDLKRSTTSSTSHTIELPEKAGNTVVIITTTNQCFGPARSFERPSSVNPELVHQSISHTSVSWNWAGASLSKEKRDGLDSFRLLFPQSLSLGRIYKIGHCCQPPVASTDHFGEIGLGDTSQFNGQA